MIPPSPYTQVLLTWDPHHLTDPPPQVSPHLPSSESHSHCPPPDFSQGEKHASPRIPVHADPEEYASYVFLVWRLTDVASSLAPSL